MQTPKLSQNREVNSANTIRGLVLVLLASLIQACSSMPKPLEVEPGMNREEVLSIMGQPKEKRIKGTREGMSWTIGEGNAKKQYVVVLDNNEVVASGSPEQAKAAMEEYAAEKAAQSTNTVNPTINVNPIINVQPGQSSQAQPVPQIQSQTTFQDTHRQAAAEPNVMGAVADAMGKFYQMQRDATTFSPGAPMRPQIVNQNPGAIYPLNPYDPASYR